MTLSKEVVICGAGIAGISTAYHLAVKGGLRGVLLVDERPPLSLTSDKSTECYRNWWPGPGNAMVALMNRSIDWMEALAEQSGNAFHLNRRGYLYLTGDPGKVPAMQREAEAISRANAGPLRVHTGGAHDSPYQPAAERGFTGQPDGADLILEPKLLRQYFPYITSKAVAGLHVRRAGWFSAQQLGAYLLEQARQHGVELLRERVSGVETHGGRVQAVYLAGGERIETPHFINAAGPLIQEVARMLDLELPVFSELHMKAAFKDHLGIIPRQAPLLIWTDSQSLPWSPEERTDLSGDPQLGWLLDEFPPGVHTRPEGEGDSSVVLMLWEYHTSVVAPTWPIPLDPQYPEIALRGLATMIPALSNYFDKLPRPYMDGGYYTKTHENRPLIGPLPIQGAYLIGALSGFGLMASCAAGELLAAHLCGQSLPFYAGEFSLQRYQNPDYLKRFEGQQTGGQL
jgi:sarcosine oxidase subunit beta